MRAGFAAVVALGLLQGAALAQTDSPRAPGASGRITSAGVVRAQAVVDSVFLDRKAAQGEIEGGDWASYLMARLGVPLPDSSGMLVAVDSTGIVISGRIQDLPLEARLMLGPLEALVDSSTALAALVVQVPAGKGLAHFRLRGVTVGGFPIPEVVLHAMLLKIGERYPALTKSGRDLLVQIPTDGAVQLRPGAVRLVLVPTEVQVPPH
ncbi:MAG: hypothetical protein ACRENB_00890 [Gemmatimonadales bacterium]